MKLEIFDPPMCCPTGVCGTDIDPALPRFAADLEWIKTRGVEVERYNLSQQPGAFVANEKVRAALETEGAGCLPLILLEGRIVSRSTYPARATLAEYAGIEYAGESEDRPGRQLTVLQATNSNCC